MPAEVLSSDDIQLLTGLAFVASGAGLSLQAAQIFESLARLRPTRAFPYVGMAVLHLNRQQTSQAVEALERGERLLSDPQNPEPAEHGILLAWKGLALHLAGRESESIRALQQSRTFDIEGSTADMVARMLGEPMETARS
jgi:tetratricopeptide (TPR) repeat protein